MEKLEKKGRGGRPPKPENELRRHNVTVALTDAELNRLQKIADQYSQPLNVMTRKLALDRKLPNQPKPKIDRDTYSVLTKIGNLIALEIKQNGARAEYWNDLKVLLNDMRRSLILGGSDDTKNQ